MVFLVNGVWQEYIDVLLDRLYELPEEKWFNYNGGVVVRDIKLSCLRTNIGNFYGTLSFSRTLKKILPLLAWKWIEEVKRAAKIASLDHAIEHFKEGYDTYVEKEASHFLCGQKQKNCNCTDVNFETSCDGI